MKLNREWHLAHRIPAKATLEQRIAWHLEHKKNCGCRDIPEKLMSVIKQKEINRITGL